MVHDEILEEVWRIRNEYAKSFNYDLDAIFSDLKIKERQSGREYVRLPEKKPSATPAVPGEGESK